MSKLVKKHIKLNKNKKLLPSVIRTIYQSEVIDVSFIYIRIYTIKLTNNLAWKDYLFWKLDHDMQNIFFYPIFCHIFSPIKIYQLQNNIYFTIANLSNFLSSIFN